VPGLDLAGGGPHVEERGSGGGDGGLEERGCLAGCADEGAGAPRRARVTALWMGELALRRGPEPPSRQAGEAGGGGGRCRVRA